MHRMCVCAFCPCAACALQGFLENQADSQGLSKAQILLVVLYMVVPVMLAIAMTLILFAIGAWQNEGSFNAVVQSALILGVGKASASLRSKSKAENADNLDELVGNIMNEQKEAVNGEYSVSPSPGRRER